MSDNEGELVKVEIKVEYKKSASNRKISSRRYVGIQKTEVGTRLSDDKLRTKFRVGVTNREKE